MKLTEKILLAFVMLLACGYLIAATPIRDLVFQSHADAAGFELQNLSPGTNASNAATLGWVTNQISAASTNYATAAEGVLASTALQPGTSITNISGLQVGLDGKLDDSQATTFGLSLLGAASNVQGREALGLPGSWQTQANSLVGVSFAADTIPLSTGTAWTNLPTGGFGRTLLGSSTDANARTLLNLGSASTNAASAFATADQGAKADIATRLAPGLVRLINNLKAQRSDAIQILGDSLSSGLDKWLGDALEAIGEHVGPDVRIVHILNDNGTGESWVHTVIQEGAGRQYYENPIGGSPLRAVNTASTPALSGDLDIRLLLSVTETERSTAISGASNGLLVNYGDGGGTGAPLTIEGWSGGDGNGNSRLRVVVTDAVGAAYAVNFNGVMTVANLGSANDLFWLRVTVDVDNGAGNSEFKAWVSKTSAASEGLAWTQLGTTQTAAVIPSWTTSLTPVELFGRQDAALLTGVRVYHYQMRTGGIGDTVAVANLQVPHTWPHNYGATAQITPRDRPTLWVVNRSVSGGSLNGLVAGAASHNKVMPLYGQSVVFCMKGTNDALYSGLFLDNLVAIKAITDARFPLSAFVTGAEPPVLPAESRWTITPWISQRSAMFGVNVGRGTVNTLLTFEEAMSNGVPLTDLISSDTVHPTPAGYQLIAEEFLRSCGITP